MIYLFYTLIVLLGVLITVEVIGTLRGRKWGENP